MSNTSKFALFKRSNGTYYVKYELDGRIRWKSTKSNTKSKALRVLTTFKELCKKRLPPVLLSSFIEEYSAYSKANHQPETSASYNHTLKHFRLHVGECLLSSITPKQVDSYKTQRLGAVSPVTVNIELRTLKAVFSVAVRWKSIEENPFTCIRLAGVPERAPVFFTKDDFQKLLSIVKENWLKDLIVFGVLTGMRRGEIVNLRWQDVDLSRRLIQIQSNATFKTKQGKRRTIPMNDLVHALLNGKLLRSNGEYVFNRRGWKIGKSYLTHSFKKAILLAKLNKELHWHSLRHTHASWLVQSGVSLYEVQKLLGHSSSKVTEIYSHLQPEFLHDTVNRIKISSN